MEFFTWLMIHLFIVHLAITSPSVEAAQSVLVLPGESATLPCDGAKEEKDLFKLLWYKRDQKVGQDVQLVEWVPGAKDLAPTVMVKEEDKIRLDEDTFSLLVNAANTSDSGLYICKGETKTSMNESPEILIDTAVELKVSLNEKPNAPPSPPNITVLDAESIKVVWEPSGFEELKPVNSYVLFVRIQDGDWSDAHPHPVSADYNSTVLFGLWPYTEYQVSVVAVNDAGESEMSPPSEWVRTNEAAPEGKPKITKVMNYSTAIYIEFSAPHESKLNGELVGYVVAIKEVDCHDEGEIKCEKDQVLDANSTSHNFTDLKPYRPYMVSLRVSNNVGDGAPLERVIWTDEGVPSRPKIINAIITKYVEVRWDKPDEPNGKIMRYWIYWTHTDTNKVKIGETKSVNISIDRARHAGGMMSYKLGGLPPYSDFLIELAAETSKGIGERDDHPALTDVISPSSPTIINVTLNSSTSIRLEWTRPEVFYRQIDKYMVKHVAHDSELEAQTTILKNDMMKEVQDVILSGLRPDTTYEIQIAASTKSIHSDQYFWGNFSKSARIETGENGTGMTTDPNRAGIIAGIVITTLVLIIAALVFIFLRVYVQRRYTFIPDPDSGQGTAILNLPDSYEDATWKYTPIPRHDTDEHIKEAVGIDNFAAHVSSLHADGDLGFSQEYEEINRNTRLDLTANNSADPENKHKNRYINIVAYDHSRVVLKVPPGKEKNNDYINANYVDGYHKPMAYIAAQGPLPSTFGDFWRMVWEENTSVVVMITNLTERGRRKCDQYWPNEGEHQYGCMSVKLLNTYTMAHYTVRMFSIKNTKMKRRGERVIYQYHYTDWPDHGVPDFTLPSLTFVRKSTAACVPDSGPIIVHCSAGVGRTGTYIVIDSMIRQIKDKSSINIFRFLSHIRNQRNYLVQTEDQYIFTHDALLEYIQSKETEVKDSNLSQYIEDLISEEGEGPPILDKHFELVTQFKPKEYHVSSAMLNVNKEKNRSMDLLPVEISRVRLPNKPGVEGSDYINASYVHGYNKNEEFVVTQHPLVSTVEDFWRMVWDQNSMTIVLLSQVDEENFGVFWPSKEESKEYSNFKVSFSDDNHQLNHVARDFIVQSTQDDYECTVRMISTSYWPESCSPLNTVFELIQTVKSWHNQHEEVEGPIIVVDKCGGTDAATFCALMTLYDQLHHEACVDVYYVSKLYHLKRPGIWPKKDDYHFLYKAMESLCEEASIPGERDSGIGNCSNYPASLPPSLSHSNSRLSTRQETTM